MMQETRNAIKPEEKDKVGGFAFQDRSSAAFEPIHVLGSELADIVIGEPERNIVCD